MEPGSTVIKVAQAGYALYAAFKNKRLHNSLALRFRSLTTQLRHVQNRIQSIDTNYASSEEFMSLAFSVVSAGLREHREVKHRMLAYALVSAAGENVSWQYEKKQLLTDLTDQLEPYHFVILNLCLHRTDWQELSGFSDIPEPRENLLINAVQRLVNDSLLHSETQCETIRFPTRVEESYFEFQTPSLEKVLQRSMFSATALGQDLLKFVHYPDGPSNEADVLAVDDNARQ